MVSRPVADLLALKAVKKKLLCSESHSSASETPSPSSSSLRKFETDLTTDSRGDESEMVKGEGKVIERENENLVGEGQCEVSKRRGKRGKSLREEEERVEEDEETSDDELESPHESSPSVPSRISRRIQAKISCYFERQKQLRYAASTEYLEDGAKSLREEEEDDEEEVDVSTVTTRKTTTSAPVVSNKRPKHELGNFQKGNSSGGFLKSKSGHNYLKQQNVRRQLREQQKQRIALRRQYVESQ